MTSANPTVVLVNGAWSCPAMFRKLISQLEKADFKVHTIDLPSNNQTRPPNAGFDEDVKAVRGVVQSCVHAGESVLMLMHSYGGAVGTEASHGLTLPAMKAVGKPGGVVAMVILAGYMLDSQWSVMKVVEKSGLLQYVEGAVNIEVDGSSLLPDSVAGLYHDLSPEDQQEQNNLVRRFNWNALNGVVAHPTWREVPTIYVRTTEDRAVPPIYQDIMIEQAKGKAVGGGDVEVLVFERGHSVYASCPEQCVDVVKMAVKKAAV